MTTMPVMAGHEREENPPRQRTQRRATLEISIKTMQAIQAVRRPVKRHVCCMAPGNLKRSVNYWRNTTTSTPHRGHTKTKKPDPTKNPSVLSTSGLIAKHKRSTPCHPLMNSSLEKKGKICLNSVRVNMPRQTHQRMGALIALTA